MEIGKGRPIGRVTAAAAVVSLLLAGVVVAAAAAAATAGVGGVGRPCFDACFDQCAPREEFWFCQFSCYHRCSGGRIESSAAARGDCEHSCVLSMCGQLDPESKMMAVCRDTCRKSYAAEGRCRRPTTATTSSMHAAM